MWCGLGVMMYFSFRSGDLIPMLGLGTYDLRGSEGAKAVATAVDMGYRHLDTAATYENEEAVGQGVRDASVPRHKLFLTTKVDRADLQKDAFIRSCEASLSRLGLEYVDLLLIHWPNDEVPLEETMEACDELVKAGKTRHVGVSNFTRRRLRESIAASSQPIAVNQVEYHPWLQQKGLLRLCREQGVLLTAYSPLGQGCILEEPALLEIGERLGRTPAQVSLRWLLENGIAAIPRSSSEHRMRENLSALEFELSREDHERIESITTGKRVIDWWPGDFGSDPDVFA